MPKQEAMSVPDVERENKAVEPLSQNETFLWVCIVVGVLAYATGLISAADLDADRATLSSAGLGYLLDTFKVPVLLLTAAIPVLALFVAIHRSKQTHQQVSVSINQIAVAENALVETSYNNLFSRFDSYFEDVFSAGYVKEDFKHKLFFIRNIDKRGVVKHGLKEVIQDTRDDLFCATLILGRAANGGGNPVDDNSEAICIAIRAYSLIRATYESINFRFVTLGELLNQALPLAEALCESAVFFDDESWLSKAKDVRTALALIEILIGKLPVSLYSVSDTYDHFMGLVHDAYSINKVLAVNVIQDRYDISSMTVQDLESEYATIS